MPSTDEGWIRPTTQKEFFFEMVHQKGIFITCYCLTLNSKEPLQESIVRTSLIHLLRKVPTLRVCIRPKTEGGFWLHELESENVDFQILEDADFQAEYEAMTVHHYDSYNGPLWCTRLLPLPPDEVCAMPEIKEKFPHQYKLLFGFHHSITDGTSSTKICSFFMDILNDVISGKSINDEEQLADYVTDAQTLELMKEVGETFMQNPTELMRYEKIVNGKDPDDVLFCKAYPPPTDVKAKTLNLAHSLSKEETSKFLSRCKKEGVTIHSGFCSVVNAAIVEMLVNAGITEDTLHIKNFHAINNRRYWKGDTSRSFGPHLGIITLISEIRVNHDLSDFWNQAREFHRELNTLLNDKGPIKEELTRISALSKNKDFSKIMQDIPGPLNYYGTTNMGNMSSVFSGEGEHVQVTDFRRTTSNFNNLCSHAMQTFRGRFIYGIDYEAKYMTKETAQLYVDTIFKILKTVTDQ